jgi:hypothetical protein
MHNPAGGQISELVNYAAGVSDGAPRQNSSDPVDVHSAGHARRCARDWADALRNPGTWSPGRELLTAFPTLHAEASAGETVLTGALADEAALHGVLAQIEALGVVLLQLRREDC